MDWLPLQRLGVGVSMETKVLPLRSAAPPVRYFD